VATDQSHQVAFTVSEEGHSLVFASGPEGTVLVTEDDVGLRGDFHTSRPKLFDLSQPKNTSGCGLGTTTTSLIFLTAIVALVAFLVITKVDKPRPVSA